VISSWEYAVGVLIARDYSSEVVSGGRANVLTEIRFGLTGFTPKIWERSNGYINGLASPTHKIVISERDRWKRDEDDHSREIAANKNQR